MLTASLVGPFGMGTTYAQTLVAQAAPQGTGTIAGSIKDASGAPVANATVTVSGPQSQTATTDSQGNFSISGLPSGIYSFRATKAGYNTASDTNITVLPGGTQTLTVTMNVLTFTSLRTIATVRSSGRGTFNTSPASVSVINSQTFVDQGQPQVMRVLDQTPGIVASYPQTSANGAAPGAITFPNIRGALSFETASLIDGHPVSVGTFGDYVTSFLNSFALGGAEVVKGPGADSPEVNYAIGGTVNFLTKNPTYQPSGNFTFGYGSHGSSILNFGYSSTEGRLGFVFDYADNSDSSALNGYQATFVPGGNNTYLNYNQSTQSGTFLNFNDSNTPVSGTASGNFNSFGTVACCYTVSGDFESRGELAKLTYKLSNATRATFTYLGSQAFADQNGNTSSMTPGTFAPGAQYANGNLQPGQAINIVNIHPGGSDNEINNEPILQGDIRTTLNNDTILARYYHASIWRLIHEGPDVPYIPETMILNVQGTNGQAAGSANITGMRPVTFFDYFQQTELDKLGGFSL
ncbi:MAG TPA: TonB-dependent receptor, partial [Candidatus Baltobacteraceae bacterium]|nr:TonB-dependent receptor [Candidatus Baltobacteraceae bacterium]